MLNLSTAFKNELNNDNRDYLCYADITLADGTVLNLENDDIWTGGMKIEDAVSNTSSFDIGAVIINKLTLVINNIYETYSEYDFTDAVVVPYIGLRLPDGTVEKLRKGVYTVDEATYNGSLITLNCLDEMHKLDYPYSESKLLYPATIGEIVQDACYVCGVNLLTTTFFNSSYTVEKRPDGDALTFRQVIAWAAQIACSWARFDTYGRLRFDWYDQSVFETHDGLNGGVFDEAQPYATGDNAHGGTFKPWTAGDSYSGGTFKELTGYHHIYSLSSMNICTDDVVITGLKVTESFEETDTEKVQSFLYGSEGYVLSIEGNDLIQRGSAKEIAQLIGQKVVGLWFRPLDVSALSDPSIEAGDPVYVTDRKSRSYRSFVTSTTFSVGNYQQIQCSAETPSRNSAQRFSEATRNIVLARREASKKISDYDKAVQMLTSLITQSFGVYKTEEKQEDGSVIYYLHNKPTLSASQTIWKMTADAFAVSTNGGKTWNAGMDSSGNAVVNVLSAIGINFDWAKGGTLTLGGQNNTNGILKVLDASGKEIGRFGKDGIITEKGTFSGSLKAADGTFKGDFSVTGFSEDKYPIKLKNSANAYFGIGGTGFMLAKSGYYIMLDYDTTASMPRLYGGTYSGINENTFALSGRDSDLYLDADGMFKTIWTRRHKTDDVANIHISSEGYLYRVSSSSRRYKEDESTDLRGIDPGRLYDLPIKTYRYKEGYLAEDDASNGKYILGIVTDDLAEIFPEAVSYENGMPETWKERVLIPAMLKLIQEQNKRISKIENRRGWKRKGRR